MKILILAVSYKAGGSCVAGVDIDTLKWIRLVSTEDGDAIIGKPTECGFEKLNIYEVEGRLAPINYQPENFLLAKRSQSLGQPRNDSLNKIVTNILYQGDFIFGDNKSVVYSRNVNSSSLCFVHVKNFSTKWTQNEQGKYKNKASFHFNNYQYNDVFVTEHNSANFDENEAYLLISLPKDEPFSKYVAAIYSI
jgi:hypothetical protein